MTAGDYGSFVRGIKNINATTRSHAHRAETHLRRIEKDVAEKNP